MVKIVMVLMLLLLVGCGIQIENPSQKMLQKEITEVRERFIQIDQTIQTMKVFEIENSSKLFLGSITITEDGQGWRALLLCEADASKWER